MHATRGTMDWARQQGTGLQEKKEYYKARTIGMPKARLCVMLMPMNVTVNIKHTTILFSKHVIFALKMNGLEWCRIKMGFVMYAQGCQVSTMAREIPTF